MPRRTDIASILIIGAGPIVIGQACEFDYSGTQAIKALKAEGYRVVLVNSNPATIMTDPELADATYIEPITTETLTRVIEAERPDALLPTLGGQTALNAALALVDAGILKKYDVEMIGANAQAIHKAEDRQLFREAMDRIGLASPKSVAVHSLAEALEALATTGLPAIIRPSFTMGGTGGGIAYNRDEFETIVKGGLEASPTHEVLIEESVLGWKEYEMEVVRDRSDNAIIICSIENIDPMGIHTGDSITVAPALTLTDKEYQTMRSAAIAVLREIGVETGGSNVQFAVNPSDGRMVVIEMNPRVSRSSALASKATGFPIAKVAAKLAVGYSLDELANDITRTTPASFEPALDYIVTKVPRFTFEKFAGAEPLLTTSMKSVGEAMAIGRNFAQSLQKALRSLEIGLSGLDSVTLAGSDTGDVEAMKAELAQPRPERLLLAAEAMRAGLSLSDIQEVTHYSPWYLEQLERIITAEGRVRREGLPQNAQDFFALKDLGFSDAQLAHLTGLTEATVRTMRHQMEVRPVFKRIDTCAGEFDAATPYLYSAYERAPFGTAPECEAAPSTAKKVIVLGSGPNRIGQGLEFDYCCCHAAFSLSEAGFETIMVNCNPETVSTDYDTSDRLYFEPLTSEDVLEIIHKEQSNGTLAGVIVQFGGQTPLKLAHTLAEAGVPILGTSPDAIDLAEDRERFQKLVDRLGLKQPEAGIARSRAEAEELAKNIGYPLLLRPSYVLGGRAMELVYSEADLQRYLHDAFAASAQKPLLVDKFLEDAIEVDVDALSDGESVHVAGIMEHIEEAGIHSGDSACSLPPYSLPVGTVEEIKRQTKILALALEVRGLMNVQFAVRDDEVFLIEVNPRASRTVPFVAKAVGSPIAGIAARLMAGEKLTGFNLKDPITQHVAVKEVVMPWARFPGVDVLLGPEMKSTGEVMGIDQNFASAFLKAQQGAGMHLPTAGQVFLSVKDRDKYAVVPLAERLIKAGYSIVATRGTAAYLETQGLAVDRVFKVNEGLRPHVLDILKNGDVQLLINTTEGERAIADSKSLRQTALLLGVPYFTTLAAGRAAVQSLVRMHVKNVSVRPIQSWQYDSA